MCIVAQSTGFWLYFILVAAGGPRYEYVEYGTTNPLTILLQRNGFSRESARKLKLKASLSKCGRTSVENDVEYIRQNVPGIFTDEEE